jgi:spermidine/putrescine transport system permease protein
VTALQPLSGDPSTLARAGTGASQGFRRRLRLAWSRREGLRGYALISPTLLAMILLLGAPLVSLVVLSFWTQTYFEFDTTPTLRNYAKLVNWQESPVYLRTLWRSLLMAGAATIAVVLLAYPIAYFLAFRVRQHKMIWLVLITVPFWTSYLLRIFAWKVILGDQGLINSAFFATGLRDDGDPMTFLLYSEFTVIIVLMYAWVPFVCLPIFIALENMDRKLLEAATDLGASRLQAFRKITLPIAAPGIVAAFLFVFIPSIGEFVTPNLVGGTAGFMFGNAVSNQFVGGTTDWQTGSVLALFLLVVVLGLTAATTKFLRQSGGAT